VHAIVAIGVLGRLTSSLVQVVVGHKLRFFLLLLLFWLLGLFFDLLLCD